MRLEIISRRPAGSPKAVPLLFVHGAFVGAAVWDAHFLAYFAEHGYSAHAVSLRGHGGSAGHESLSWHSLADYVDDLRRTVAVLDAPPVLIGHSMGGMVVQKYLEMHAVPGLVLMVSCRLTVPCRRYGDCGQANPYCWANSPFSNSSVPVLQTYRSCVSCCSRKIRRQPILCITSPAQWRIAPGLVGCVGSESIAP
ncbi:MAG: alpha/beta fold hydrolase [Candidatus Competibacteraceae bacterium]